MAQFGSSSGHSLHWTDMLVALQLRRVHVQLINERQGHSRYPRVFGTAAAGPRANLEFSSGVSAGGLILYDSYPTEKKIEASS